MNFIKSILVCCWMILLTFTQMSCTSKQTEKDYNNIAAREYFTTTLLPILESQCNSCHVYHNTSLTQYASFETVAESIDAIINRIDSDLIGCMMPPASADTLTEAEHSAFLEFFDLLNRKEPNEAEVSILFEAFKYPLFNDRVGVVGEFETYEITLQNNAVDIFEKLQDAEIKILTSSINMGDHATKTSNVLQYFFHHLRVLIHGKVKSINSDTAVVAVELNGIIQDVSFSVFYEDYNNKITFFGTIDDLHEFNLTPAFEKLNEQCGSYHDGFVWPDVDIKIVIDNYDLL